MSEDSKELRVINDVILHSQDSVVPEQASSDEQLIALWIHARSVHTQRYYNSDVTKFRCFVGKPLRSVILADLQRFADSLDECDIVAGTKRRTLASVKSLFAFGFKLGYFPFDTARPLKVPKPKDTLSERILSEEQVQKIIILETHPRNYLLIKLLYCTAIRVSECCGLKWKDLTPRKKGGQMVIYGKGNKTSVKLLLEPLWNELQVLNKGISKDPVFKSRKGGHLHPGHILRIVRKAAQRAGMSGNISPHFFRHSHASHCLDRGCPIHVVQAQLSHASVATTGKYLHVRPNETSSKYLPI